MKLKDINEGLLSLKAREYFNRPQLHISQLYNSDNANDAMAINSGMSQYTTGVPSKPRYRKYFGQSRPGTIRL